VGAAGRGAARAGNRARGGCSGVCASFSPPRRSLPAPLFCKEEERGGSITVKKSARSKQPFFESGEDTPAWDNEAGLEPRHWFRGAQVMTDGGGPGVLVLRGQR